MVRKFLASLILALLMTGVAHAEDYWVYIRLEDRPGVTQKKDAGRSKSGDVVEVIPVSQTPEPTDEEKSEWAIVLMSDLTVEEIKEMKEPWIDDSTGERKAFRKKKLDVKKLNLKKGKRRNKLNKKQMKDNRRDKNNGDLSMYNRKRIFYANIQRPLIRLSHVIVPQAHAENISIINKTGEDYNTLALWEDAKDGDLVTAQLQETAEIYADDGDLAEEVWINGSTTNSQYYMRIVAADEDSHSDSAALRPSAQSSSRFVTNGSAWRILNVQDDYVQIEGLRFEHDGGNRSHILVENVTNVLIRNNIFEGSVSSDGAVHVKLGSSGTNTVENNLFFGSGTGTAIIFEESGNVYNNTVINYGNGISSYSSGTSLVAKNNVSALNTGSDFHTAFSGAFDSSSTNNASEDSTAPAFNTFHTSITPANEFVNVSSGTEDFKLNPSSTTLRQGGADLSSDLTDDIFGLTRTVSWDIGAHEDSVTGGGGGGGGSGTDYTADANAVAAYNMDETTGNIIDQTSNSNDCTLTGATYNVTGQYGGAVSFDGVDDYLDCGSSTELDALSSGTATFWFKFDNLPGATGRAIFAKDNANRNDGDFGAHYGFVTTSNQLDFFVSDAANDYDVIANSAQSADTWYHGAFVWGTGGMRMYIDGVLQTDTDAYTGGMTNASATLIIGSLRNGVFHWEGDLDEFALFSRQLNSTEINEIKDCGIDGSQCNTIPILQINQGLFTIDQALLELNR